MKITYFIEGNEDIPFYVEDPADPKPHLRLGVSRITLNFESRSGKPDGNQTLWSGRVIHVTEDKTSREGNHIVILEEEAYE